MGKLYYININRRCYNKLAPEYLKKDKTFDVGIQLAKIVTEQIEENIGSESNRTIKILELGVGVGTILKALNSDNRYELYGIDLSEKMVELAKDNCKRAEIVRRNVLNIDDISNVFKSVDKFDCIIMAAFIHLFPRKDAETLLNKIKTWLNPDGIIYIDTTEEGKFKKGEISEKQEYNKKAYRLRTRWTKDTFKNLLNDFGFEIVFNDNYPPNPASNEKQWLRRVVKLKKEK